MESRFSGNAHVYGDDIDTDRIIAGKYTKTLNLQDLADHVLEDLDVDFRSKLVKGDVLVGGTNFGCGSSREQAPLALKVAGVSAVIAKYFARIFFRNAINIGLPVMEVPDLEVETGDELELDLGAGTVTNVTKGTTYQASAMPEVMINILSEGGLVAYLKNHGDYDTSAI
jgi:3-isopropylmalate/(R)-2-methylmalate dehydratase small subunit